MNAIPRMAPTLAQREALAHYLAMQRQAEMERAARLDAQLKADALVPRDESGVTWADYAIDVAMALLTIVVWLAIGWGALYLLGVVA